MFKYEGISSSPPKALLSEGSWFLCSYTSCSESSLDLVLKIKQKLKPWEELLCSVAYSVFLIKKKKVIWYQSVQPTDPQVLPCDFSV